MKTIILGAIAVSIGLQTYAAPFESAFPNFKGIGFDSCPATSIMANAVERGGVNPIDGSGVQSIYDCNDLGTTIPLDSKIKINGELQLVDGNLQQACRENKKVVC